MAQSLRILTALSENLGSVPRQGSAFTEVPFVQVREDDRGNKIRQGHPMAEDAGAVRDQVSKRESL